jgi:hypothetical protein
MDIQSVAGSAALNYKIWPKTIVINFDTSLPVSLRHHDKVYGESM